MALTGMSGVREGSGRRLGAALSVTAALHLGVLSLYWGWQFFGPARVPPEPRIARYLELVPTSIELVRPPQVSPATSPAAAGPEHTAFSQQVSRNIRPGIDHDAGGRLLGAPVGVDDDYLAVPGLASSDARTGEWDGSPDLALREPIVLRRVLPEYPPLARQASIEGVVQVLALVDLDGRVRDVSIVASENAILEPAALAAALEWVFIPAREHDEPVAVRVLIPFRFELVPARSDGV